MKFGSTQQQKKLLGPNKWSVGDLLIWKNLYVLHKRDAFDPNTTRIMHRTQIKGDTDLN